jgi:glycosyltransferase involved in cell wall biosynthesis
MGPKFSIITINLNDKEGLESTIKSVILQDFRNFEYIIIDGGSVDGSLGVIKKYENYINYWISETDDGIYQAINKGINKSTGEYCIFLHSRDTFYDSGVLSAVYRLNAVQDILYGDIIKRKSGDEKYTKYDYKISKYFLSFSTIWHQSAFIKRELFERIGVYNECYRLAADYDFWLRALLKNRCTSRYICIPFTIFDMNGISSKEESRKAGLLERKKIFIRNFSVFEYYFFLVVRKLENSTFGKAYRKVIKNIHNN